MADILVKHYQAATLDMVKEKAPPRVVAMAQDVAALVLREEDGEENPVVRIFPSTVGQGMGRRYAQTAHGFILAQPVRWTAGGWVLAQATADESTLATHMVVSVPDADTFEVASFGAWNLGSTPQGRFYLSTVAGELVSAAPTSALVQLVATGDGTSFHLCLGASTQKSTDQLVEELNDRSDLTALPKGQAGGDLLGQYPDPVVQKLTGLSVTWESMEPKWATTGLPFVPTNYVLAAAWKPLSTRAMLVDNAGRVYFSETDGTTWRDAGYTVCQGSVRDIAYGKISGTTYGWCVIGDDALEWIPDLPENFVGGVPLSSAWSETSMFGSWTDICYCEALGAWFFQRQGAGLVYCYELAVALVTATVTPQGASANTGGVFYEASTGRVVYFERGTGRVWWADAGFTIASGWTEVLLGGVPVLKAITPAMSDSNGYGAGVSTLTIAAFVGSQGVVSTTSIADPTKYTQSIGAGALPSLWDVSSNGTDLIGSTVNNIDPVLYKIYVTLGEIPSEQRIVGKKGFLAKGPLILEGRENAPFLGTDEWGTVIKKTSGEVLGEVDFITFDTTPEAVPTAVGTVSWNADEGTQDIQQPYGVTLQVGQEVQIHVINKSGVAIPNGAPVYITGAQGNRPSVALAEADVLAHANAIAVSTMDIANNAEGFVTRVGLVRQLNTLAWSEGDALYLSDTPGVLTNVAPTSRKVRVAYVVRDHATVGSIFVSIEGTPNLDDLGDVDATAPTEGYYLKFVAGRWVPAAVSGGGGGSVTAKYAATMPLGAASTNVQLANGNSTQWVAHGTILVPESDIPLVQNVSKFAIVCPQPVSGAKYILAIYAWPSTGATMTLVAETTLAVMPGSSSWLEATMTSAGVTLVGGTLYFAVVLWDGNGGTAAGVYGANLNVQPYIAFYKANLGVLTVAPSTLIPDGEVNQHFFMRLLA